MSRWEDIKKNCSDAAHKWSRLRMAPAVMPPYAHKTHPPAAPGGISMNRLHCKEKAIAKLLLTLSIVRIGGRLLAS
jgi:hypothetical protein